MRLVSQEMNATIEANKNAQANFGLVFNKWLIFDGCEPIVTRNKQPLIDSYGKSSKQAEEILKQRHIQQAEYCRAMEKSGWRSFIIHARLTSPFVSGLGMTHPTETGMVLDHTSGMPYIPAASQKGVLRLAHVINSLLDDAGNWMNLDKLLERGIVKEVPNKDTKKIEQIWQEDDASKKFFGFSEKKNSLAGQLVVLDAYPLNPPALGEEILNPHFMKYYGGERGPTEDQSPIPIKFLVVKQGADFVFRLLLRCPLDKTLEKDQEKKAGLIEKNLRRAISEEGMGAKTALGFGRFEIIAPGEPETVLGWIRKQQEKEEQEKYPWRPTVRKIKQAKDWNQLAQLLDNNDIKGKYQTQPEIGQAFKEVANHIRKDKPKSWNEKRDNKMAEWLTLSGTVWDFLVAATEPITNSFTPEEQAAMEQIVSIKGWSADLLTKVNATILPKQALLALRDRMKKDWGCDERRAKNDKKQAWQQLNLLLRKG